MISKQRYKSDDLIDALKNADKIKALELSFPAYNFDYYRNDLLKFQNLELLKIQFDVNYSFILPDEFGQLKSLKKLHLLNYPFKNFPDWIFRLDNLENLMLRGNNIKEIPRRISTLTNLKHLRIENSKLQMIPDELSLLYNLVSLSLVDNFDLKKFNEKVINDNLQMLALIPSGIPNNLLQRLEKEFPKIKMNKRYFR